MTYPIRVTGRPLQLVTGRESNPGDYTGGRFGRIVLVRRVRWGQRISKVFCFCFCFSPCTVETGKQSRSISAEQLRALVDCSSSGSVELPDKLKALDTLMRKEVWATELEGYPDRTLAKIITQDVAEGFRVCFKAGKTKLVERSRNMKSAEKQEEVVEA